MFGNFKRNLTLVAGTIALGACQVIPDAGNAPTTSAPVPETGPSDTQLPQDLTRHRVALLLPMSGTNAGVGQSIANATTMALLDTNADNLRITTYDTAKGAGNAANRAIADGNKVILGPLLGDNVTSVLAQARPADVPLITFSNNLSVADQDVFVMGHIPEQSVIRTVDYAIANGSRRFAALVPTGEYGQRAAAALRSAVEARGATYVTTKSYDRGNRAIIRAAGQLDEQGGFDTVLIADGAKLSSLAATELKDAGEKLPQILGTDLWSGESSIANASALQGAWFSAVSDSRYRQFVSSYESRFGQKPYRIATLGYDAVLLTLRVARDWKPGRKFPVSEMVAEDGFLGLDGPFRFKRDGVGERAMEVRQVGNGTITVIDPAPQRFDN
ncbi:penicillin-binding protein activator [Altericroceibacterium endophyticum]|uniref:ABC transporter substrate-binding protein n=1 Tax=Altericroceibacterium endophyticum TaxID=1808508 RepID=A0A6I4T388_9SPHN|nr:penicillin-binding protein activator [Altericroceibacterium endophyticum]MXO64450.1 ABC transporter substrate-binding protein [Altericroceibacterium endophyticum]